MYQKWQSYDLWFQRYRAQQTDFFVILDHFLTFFPPNNPKIKILKKWKKHLELLIIFLRTCTINDNHTMHGSWDMECDRQNVLSFRTIFCTFTLLKTQQIKILKKMKKKAWRYYHFTHVYHKWQLYDVWFLIYEVWQTKPFVILDCFLPFYPP